MEVADELARIVRSGPQDLTWQRQYETVGQLVDDLRDHADRLRAGDGSRMPELRYLLLPTGPLNEIAISSGWAGRYVTLANRFDALYPGPG